MKTSILKSKIKRNNLEEYAGAYFRDDTSQIINSLNAEGKCALFGIQKEDGIYTIIGRKDVYYSTVLGTIGEIPLNDFSDILHHNALKKGKEGIFEFIAIKDKESPVWLYNKSTMNALWNIILWMNP
ncbi:hypothetical protein [Flavobacterium sp. FlaQc-48]|uniref:hypothetical protein n=1 Tax=Flavobacterium sp. FlaQc-48 TaxID=3374181 RepID=UPI0037575B22